MIMLNTSRLPALRAGKPLDRVRGHSLREYQLQRTVPKVNEESIYTKNVGLGFETRNSFRFFYVYFNGSIIWWCAPYSICSRNTQYSGLPHTAQTLAAL